MDGESFGRIFFLLYVALILGFALTVVYSLTRMCRSLDDIAKTLRRIESNQPQSNQPSQS
jgi:TRAP-type C4-dicarboxylate transport system permease small subunit